MSEHHTHSHPNGHPNGHIAATATTVTNPLEDVVLLSRDAEYKFTFKQKTIVDESGQKQKRPPLTLSVPVPTWEGLNLSLARSEKVVKFVLELVEDAIKDQVREQISDDEKPVMRQEDLDLSKLSLDYIASIEKSQRGGPGIDEDTWKAFAKSYIEIMADFKPSDPDWSKKTEKHTEIFLGKFNKYKTDKPVLRALRDLLLEWGTRLSDKNPVELEELEPVITFLDARATDFINKDNQSQVDALM
jgi:hypothetical protein